VFGITDPLYQRKTIELTGDAGWLYTQNDLGELQFMAEINKLRCKKGAFLIPRTDNAEETLSLAAESPDAENDLTWWNRAPITSTECSTTVDEAAVSQLAQTTESTETTEATEPTELTESTESTESTDFEGATIVDGKVVYEEN